MSAEDFISLSVVKSQLRVEHGDDDERIEWCIDKGVAIVLDYLKVSEDSFLVGSPPALDVPFHIEAAIMLTIEAIYDKAGDPITDAVKSLLARSRDPAVA